MIQSMEFDNLTQLTIKKVGDYWRVVMLVEGVKHVTDKETVQECFESLYTFQNEPDFDKRLEEFKKSFSGVYGKR